MHLALDASIAHVPATERTASELDDMDTLVRTYRPRLLRFVAFSVGDADLAESITQDCFLKAYNARDRFRGDCSVSTWLTSIAVNLIRDHQRLQKFRFWRQARATAIDITDAANFLPSHESSPESRLLVKEKASQVHAALQNLSPNQRTVFLMRFSEDLELSEIAAITNIPVNTVKTHLHRALKSVRNQVRAAQSAAQPATKPTTSDDARSPQPRRRARSAQPAATTTPPHPAGETL
jgi:RNA polymerase sigma-70 factor (ECF subfamily)